MTVTIKTIAEKTGLSVGTVSQALRNSPQTSKKNIEKVKAVAATLGYTPSDLGKALQAGRSSLIGYCLADITKTYYVEIMQGMASEAAKNGYGILFVSTSYDSKEQIQQIKFLEKKRVEGIISSGCEPDTWNYLGNLSENGFPVVVSENIAPCKIKTVKTDDFLGGTMAAVHFAELGHKKMLYFNPGKEFNLRLNGFQDELKVRNLAYASECTDEKELYAILKRNDHPTAIFAYCDFDAMHVRTIALMLGLSIPDDISIIGFDDDVYSSFSDVELTTFRPQKQEVGRESMRTLLGMVQGDKVADYNLIKPEFIIRKSTAQLSTGRDLK